jgi:branched-chain amino acid aminotransferase
VQHEIPVQRTTTPHAHPPEDQLGFGQYFTDHMFQMEYDAGTGWHSPRVQPRAALSLDPAAAVLHYGQALFEGLKAFRGVDGTVRLFRALDHCRRLNVGAARLCMPAIDPELMLQALQTVVHTDRDWVPASPGTALYLRPTMIATEGFLGVRAARQYSFFIIQGPVGSYYGNAGLAPVKIWVEDRYVRAARGGLGAVKAGANYAASLLAAEEAKTRGYAQVLWLDASQHRELEEVGTMNLFVRIGDEVITPPLGGSILAGMTRDSVLTLLNHWGVRTSERTLTIDEIVAAHRAGTLREVFGTGTAAVISPVGELGGEACGRLVINDHRVGELSQRLYDAITGIQYGREPDPFGWLTDVG